MNAILICPSDRPNLSLLAETVPLSNVPFLGQTLVEYWLTFFAEQGVKQVSILADDRPEQVSAIVADGARWGIKAKVIKESRSLTAAQALLKYDAELNPAPTPDGITVLDHFPNRPHELLLNSYSTFVAGILSWMPLARTPDRVGLRELAPGIWAGLQARIAPDATLKAPCWIGKGAYIGAGASIGPNAVVEDGSFVEPDAIVANSYVGPDTFVGRYTEVGDSIAWGNRLINWKNESVALIPDPFVLCALRRPRNLYPNGWFNRVAERCARNKEDLQLLWKHFLMNREG